MSTQGYERQVTVDELRSLRTRAQCLAPRLPKQALVDVVKALCGVQAQLPSAMELALRARVKDLTIEDIEKSRVEDRTLVRTWCMRGSMHLLAADDLDWQLSSLAPSVRRSAWHWFEQKHGLDRDYVSQILDEALRVLRSNGPTTRPDLMEAVAAAHGPQAIPAAAGVVQLNGLLGRVCFGPDRGAEPTYVALEEWLGRTVSVSEKASYETLARRYLQGYGPAGPRDLAAWWGCSLAEARKAWAALEPDLTEMSVEGQPVWRLSSPLSGAHDARRQGRIVRLLPAFDQYLLGYDVRDFAVPAIYQERVFHGGQLVPVVLVDGSAEGTWRYERRGKQFRIVVESFSSLSSDVRDLIAEEADDIGRFYHLTIDLGFSQH
jgi:hypothetical protein